MNRMLGWSVMLGWLWLGGNWPEALGDERVPPTPSEAVMAAQSGRVAAMAKATASTVGVFGVDSQGGGSGVIISADGYVVTNFHVSSPFGSRMRCGLSDGRMYEAVIVSIDPTGDLALLKMYGREDFVPATLGDSDRIEVGEWCFAAGNPFVLATNLQPSVSYGLISGVHRYQYPSGTILEYTDCLQTDAAINPGNSGGPLFDSRGDLIGINGRCSFEKRSRVNVGVGYAISINQVRNFLGQMRSGRLVDHASAGFTVATDQEKGVVMVSNILESSDAFRRGLRYGDEILSLAGRSVATTNEFKNILGIFPSEWRIPLRYRNANGEVDTWIRLPRLHQEEELWKLARADQGEEHGPPPEPREGESPEMDEPEAGKEAHDHAPDDEGESKDVLHDRLEAREGYINYYFNRLEMERILGLEPGRDRWRAGPSGMTVQGVVTGETTSIAMHVSQADVRWTFDGRESVLRTGREWSESINATSHSSLAIGLQLWMRWHREGPRKLGDTHYFGEAPIRGSDTLYDVTHSTIGELNCAFYTDRKTGRIRLMELQADVEKDPAEIYFDEQDVEGATLGGTMPIPKRMQLVFGVDGQMDVTLQAAEAWEPAQGEAP